MNVLMLELSIYSCPCIFVGETFFIIVIFFHRSMLSLDMKLEYTQGSFQNGLVHQVVLKSQQCP